MYHIIINPASRSGNGQKLWSQMIEPYLISNQIPYKAYFSNQAGNVKELAFEITSNIVDAPLNLLILGGDGTFNEALQGIADFSKVILGYIPTGSSNDLARDLKIPKDPIKALELILHHGTVHDMDVGCISFTDGESHRFAVSCGVGFDAAVCEESNRSKFKVAMNRIGLGKLTYLGIAVKTLFAARKISCQITLDNQTDIHIQRVLFVATMIHRYEGGGFQFCPDADSSDGILNLCTVGDVSKLLIICALPTAFFGKHYWFKGVTPYSAKEVHIKTSSPLWIHTDGEILRQSDEFTIQCHKQVIQLIY